MDSDPVILSNSLLSFSVPLWFILPHFIVFSTSRTMCDGYFAEQ